LAVSSNNRKPKRLDNKEMPARGYNTSSDVVLGGDLPPISKTFKKSANLLQEDHGGKRKASGDQGETPAKQKKIKK